MKSDLPFKKNFHADRSLVLSFVLFVSAGATLACFITDLLKPKRIVEGKPFAPTASMVIESGSYHVESVNIPASVKVDFSGDVEMIVDSDMAVSGTIAATCSNMRFVVGGNLDFSGAMNNQCSGDVENPPGIFMQIQGDSVGLGEIDSTAEIKSSGDVTVIIGPEREAWEYDMHPDVRPAEKTAPVCSATSDTAGLTLFQGEPATAVFSASGVDPDGGPVSYYWSFGDGETSSEQNSAHAFRTAGVYQVQMVGMDDDGQSCQEVMIIVVFDEEGGIETPGVSVVLSDVVMEQNVPVEFRAEVYNPAGGEIAYSWQVGDYYSSEEAPISAFEQAGRYNVWLAVTNSMGVQSTATASIYIFPSLGENAGVQHNAALKAPPNCTAPAGAYLVFNPVAEGRNIRIDYWPILHESPIMIMDTAIITAKNGESFNPLTGKGRVSGKGAVYGENGGHGGNIIIRNWVSDTIVCGGASLIVGDGGDGQDAASISNGPSRSAYARGGNGGAPGDLVLAVQPWNKLIIQAGPTNNNVSIFPGDGGLGGDALAIGGDGADDCQAPGRGGEATAVGGRGGPVSYVLTFNGVFRGGGKIEIGLPGGNGGGGGRAAALGGKGGSAWQANGLPCDAAPGKGCANGSSGGKAIARGGNGGSAFLFLKANAVNKAIMVGGNGGDVRAEGGHGGDGDACCQLAVGPNGGNGGQAEEVRGQLGKGNNRNGAAGISIPGVTITVAGQTVNTHGAGSGGTGGAAGNGVKSIGQVGIGGEGKGKNVSWGDGGGVQVAICLNVNFTPTAAPGEKPKVVGLEFPIGHTIDLGLIDWTLDIPADGSKVVGKVWYSDPDGDMSYAYFKPADDDTVFDPFGFYLADLGDEDRGGDLYNGYFIFWITCPERGEHYFQFTLQDSAGNWSNWKTFVFKCR
jgi:PKD repeat protein